MLVEWRGQDFLIGGFLRRVWGRRLAYECIFKEEISREIKYQLKKCTNIKDKTKPKIKNI